MPQVRLLQGAKRRENSLRHWGDHFGTVGQMVEPVAVVAERRSFVATLYILSIAVTLTSPSPCTP